jgi:hypothetical protein
MVNMKEQRVCIKFCFKLGKSVAKTHQMIKQAFGDDALGETQTYDWFNRFKNGRMSADEDKRSGQPSTSTTPENVAKMCEVICEDRRRSIQHVCNILVLSYGTCQRILSDKIKHETDCCKIRAKAAD